jgi:hypothetical protein
MKVYGLWHGGSSFSQPELSDTQEFASIRKATEWFWTQQHPEVYVCYPDPKDDGGPSMRLYTTDPREDRDPYPFAEMSFGRGGAIRREQIY